MGKRLYDTRVCFCPSILTSLLYPITFSSCFLLIIPGFLLRFELILTLSLGPSLQILLILLHVPHEGNFILLTIRLSFWSYMVPKWHPTLHLPG
jgi:hypothetical protein